MRSIVVVKCEVEMFFDISVTLSNLGNRDLDTKTPDLRVGPLILNIHFYKLESEEE
jgi:hypothetical protein